MAMHWGGGTTPTEKIRLEEEGKQRLFPCERKRKKEGYSHVPRRRIFAIKSRGGKLRIRNVSLGGRGGIGTGTKSRLREGSHREVVGRNYDDWKKVLL